MPLDTTIKIDKNVKKKLKKMGKMGDSYNSVIKKLVEDK